VDDIETTLLRLETMAWEASKNHDVNFYLGYLAEDAIAISPFGKREKLDVLNDLVINRTEMKGVAAYRIEDPRVIVLGPESGLVTYAATVETEHEGTIGGMTILSTTVYARRDNEWKAVLLQQTPVY
jgi:hypothetical protein